MISCIMYVKCYPLSNQLQTCFEISGVGVNTNSANHASYFPYIPQTPIISGTPIRGNPLIFRLGTYSLGQSVEFEIDFFNHCGDQPNIGFSHISWSEDLQYNGKKFFAVYTMPLKNTTSSYYFYFQYIATEKGEHRVLVRLHFVNGNQDFILIATTM